MEGYESGDAKAEEILDIPENVPDETGWPSDELLLAVGANFGSTGTGVMPNTFNRNQCDQ